MLVDVKAFLFNTLVHTQAMQVLDAVEQDETTGGSPKINDKDSEAFCTEESPTVTIEGTVRRTEQARHQCAENTTNSMDAGGTDGIINV